MDEGKKSLTYFKLYVEDFNVYRENLSKEQFATLLYAIMDYVVTSVKEEIEDPVIRMLYSMQTNKINGQIVRYEKKCESNRVNGAAGGSAKARNAKLKADTSSAESNTERVFKPPTKTEFKDIAKCLKNDDVIECTNAEIDELFESLKGKKWMYHSVPIKNIEAVRAIIENNYTTNSYFHETYQDLDYFDTLFLCCNGEYEEDMLEEFSKFYVRKDKQWLIDGKTYTDSLSAAHAYLKAREEGIEPPKNINLLPPIPRNIDGGYTGTF